MADRLQQRREDIRWSFDDALCERVSKSLAVFKDSLDAAVAQPTPEALDELREATDRLMRAASRVLLEVSRADARLH